MSESNEYIMFKNVIYVIIPATDTGMIINCKYV